MYSILSRSFYWKKIRKIHLEKEKFCQACGRTNSLEVHHIIPVSIDKSKEYDLENLITLCRTCHFVFGHFMNWNSWNIDIRKDSRQYYEKITNKPIILKVQYYEKNTVINWFINIFNKYFCWYNRS